ncbi:aminotransferase class V-fold PLP-dependent enzyme [Sphingomonas changnyeongensis]|uniref:Cysteine desulfurase n=1 Tax=Sphingomonas changnyeongensis TaxID=2698679 RepID=A0A7Z2NWR4_9SPHN|nr:cysteine desulfurase family protein [Sphingomonas changnyeongensis]QHL90819.1 aminotransferase class V-fold PLP-dependent enzyme [Sphingomonas changnyeongensis]
MTPIYLDYQATTPLAPEALAAMGPWLEARFANPHSPHRPGREAAAAVAFAREQLVAAIGLAGGRLVFTSGATEAVNLAIKGAAWASPRRRRIVALASEHACVLDTLGWLGQRGFQPVLVPVGADGLVDPDRLAAAVDDDTLLVAAMLVNNEIGAIQPVARIAEVARAAGALFLCDAVQGLGRVAIPDADLVAVSAHKIHGPKGIGALWVRDGVALEPLLHGGGQEGGLRSGTQAPALCAGFGAAAELAAGRMVEDRAHAEALAARARARLTGWQINGGIEQRWPGNLNVRCAGLDAARLIADVRGVAFSAGSACASGSGRPSHVLRAIGLADAEARASIRLGFGRYTRVEELNRALDMILDAADKQGLKAA